MKQPKDHRVWYALADLEERAGNLARARELFTRWPASNPASPTSRSASSLG
ncbi:MAG: tetratricopeptide repeat protein [Acidimicrobiia bacterium]